MIRTAGDGTVLGGTAGDGTTGRGTTGGGTVGDGKAESDTARWQWFLQCFGPIIDLAMF